MAWHDTTGCWARRLGSWRGAWRSPWCVPIVSCAHIYTYICMSIVYGRWRRRRRQSRPPLNRHHETPLKPKRTQHQAAAAARAEAKAKAEEKRKVYEAMPRRRSSRVVEKEVQAIEGGSASASVSLAGGGWGGGGGGGGVV